MKSWYSHSNHLENNGTLIHAGLGFIKEHIAPVLASFFLLPVNCRITFWGFITFKALRWLAPSFPRWPSATLYSIPITWVISVSSAAPGVWAETQRGVGATKIWNEMPLEDRWICTMSVHKKNKKIKKVKHHSKSQCSFYCVGVFMFLIWVLPI